MQGIVLYLFVHLVIFVPFKYIILHMLVHVHELFPSWENQKKNKLTEKPTEFMNGHPVMFDRKARRLMVLWYYNCCTFDKMSHLCSILE